MAKKKTTPPAPTPNMRGAAVSTESPVVVWTEPYPAPSDDVHVTVRPTSDLFINGLKMAQGVKVAITTALAHQLAHSIKAAE